MTKLLPDPTASELPVEGWSDDRVPRLGESLVRAALIQESDLEAALHLQTQKGSRLGESLIELGCISEEQLIPIMEDRIGIHCVRLREGLIDPGVVKVIPQRLAEQKNVLALFQVRGELTVAMSEPTDLDAIDEIERVTGYRVRTVFAFRSAIERMIRRVYAEDFVVDAVTADLDETSIELNDDIQSLDVMSIEELADGSPIINLVNFILVQALRQKVSDIHIEPGRKCTSVRFRVDGQLVESLQPLRRMHAAIVSRIKVMAKLDIAEQRYPQDGRCQVSVDGNEVDLRVSTLPTVIGEKVVIRVLDRSRLTFNLDDLGMSSNVLSATKRLITKPHGLVLVTGPTGSGKSTTLYSALELMKSIRTNIVTVEDPVEYQLELINQVQADKNRSFDFANALRAILRQDPDIIMVGEIRDSETASMAVQAALTGHLVLSTLHTNDSCSAVTRLTDMGVESYKVAAALAGVIAQRLVRKICPKCKTNFYPSSDQLAAIHYVGKTQRMFARGRGCRECLDTGYRGRLGIYEVMEVDQPLRDLIVRETNIESVRRWFQDKGGKTLLESGIELAEQEVTSLEEISRIALFD